MSTHSRRWVTRSPVVALVGASALLASLGAVPASASTAANGLGGSGSSLAVPTAPSRTPAPPAANSATSPTEESTAPLQSLGSGASSQNLSSSPVVPDAAIGNPAGCYVTIDDAHIASSIKTFRAVKVNARIQCRVPVQALALEVNLYKKHIFNLLGELQATSLTDNTGRSTLSNQQTFRKCTNNKATEWYGQATALAEEGGQVYSRVVTSPHTRTLNCGT